MACHLISGFWGLSIQGLLFLGVCLALFCKKQLDDPPRSWPTFLADSSKQLIGAGWSHLLNLVCSWALDALGDGREDGDACDWYFINIVVDCTLGVVVEYLLMKGLLFVISRIGDQSLLMALENGNYYEPVGYGGEARFHKEKYFKQLLMWLSIVTQMKLIFLALFLATRKWLLVVSHMSLDSIPGDEVKLVVVMLAVPFIMNTLQVCLVDAFLKHVSRH